MLASSQSMNTKGTILVVDDEESHRYTTA